MQSICAHCEVEAEHTMVSLTHRPSSPRMVRFRCVVCNNEWDEDIDDLYGACQNCEEE